MLKADRRLAKRYPKLGVKISAVADAARQCTTFQNQLPPLKCLLPPALNGQAAVLGRTIQ